MATHREGKFGLILAIGYGMAKLSKTPDPRLDISWTKSRNSESVLAKWAQPNILGISVFWKHICEQKTIGCTQNKLFLSIVGPYGPIWVEILWKWIVYQLSSYWNQFWTKIAPGKITTCIKLPKTINLKQIINIYIYIYIYIPVWGLALGS